MLLINKVIIVGAGIGGLCAAAALSPCCRDIIIYCKDSHPATPQARRSVPQGSHISILLQAGLVNLGKLFPDIQAELLEQGAAEIQAGIHQQIHEFGRWLPERPLDLHFLGTSRPFLEHIIYNRVKALPNVTLSEGNRVAKLLYADDHSVAGVEVVDSAGGVFEDRANLVVDAAGVGGKFAGQLQDDFGHTIPTESLDIGIFYSTAFFRKPADSVDKKENILIVPEAGQTDIGGSLIDVENDRWCISIHGRNHVAPPKNLEQWLEMAKQLPDPRIWERAQTGTLIGEIELFKKPNSRWRRFEQCDWLPAGYIPIGDTISSVNPIFGQGITVTVGHAIALMDTIGKDGFTDQETVKRYLKGAAHWSQLAWKKTKAYDENFTKLSSMTEKQLVMLKGLANARYQRMVEDAEAHLNFVLQSQMLL